MLKILLPVFVLVLGSLWIASRIITRNIEQQFPPIGEFRSLNAVRVHFVDVPVVNNKEAPVLVFVHGAGGNLRDPMAVYGPGLEDEFRLIFLDRPGQGYSEAFSGSNDPKQQAASIAGLLDALGIEKAIIIGHSFGGVVTAAFGVLFPEKTAGLVLLAPVSHPWGTTAIA